MKFAKKGFSLIEIIFAMFMVGLLMTFGMIYLKGGVASADSHSLALVTAEALRVARQTAMTTQEPVAVMLPTSNGSTPMAQSLYIATDLPMAHVTSVNLFTGNNPQSALFAGIWPVSAGAFSI